MSPYPELPEEDLLTRYGLAPEGLERLRLGLLAIARAGFTPAELGLALQSVLVRDHQLTGARHAIHRPRTGLRDLLPLPAPPCELMSLDQVMQARGNTDDKFAVRCEVAWEWVITFYLNQEFCGVAGFATGKPDPDQAAALVHARRRIKEFCACTERAPRSMLEELGKKAYSYWGEEVAVAIPLTLAQVEPALPPDAAVGVVDLLSILEGRLKDQLADPEALILPRSAWPASPPRASTMLAAGEEWLPLAQALFRKGICGFTREEEIFAPGGRKVINGLFGVSKKKQLADGREVLRLICNLVPVNSYLSVIRGEVDELPYIMQWGSFALCDGEKVAVSQEDMTAAFYCFRMPEAWHKYFAVGLPLLSSDLGLDGHVRGYLTVRVLPMGFGSAVGVMQAVARKILNLKSPSVARSTEPVPVVDAQQGLRILQAFPLKENCRSNTLVPGEPPGDALCVGLTEDYFKGPVVSAGTVENPELVRQLVIWVRQQLVGFEFTSIQINHNTRAAVHVDGNNRGPSRICALGSFERGALWVYTGEKCGQFLDLTDTWHLIDGTVPHAVAPFTGTRWSVVLFTHCAKPGARKVSTQARDFLESLGFPLPPDVCSLPDACPRRDLVKQAEKQFVAALDAHDLDESGVPYEFEITKARPLPANEEQRLTEAWHVYLDNFAVLETVAEAGPSARESRALHRWHIAAREAWASLGIPSSAEKSVVRSFRAVELGAQIDGEAGTMSTTPHRRLTASVLGLFLAGVRSPSRLHLAVVAGRWNFCFQFRRPVSGIFCAVWDLISRWNRPRALPWGVVRELMTAAGLSPLMVTDLRAQVLGQVSASDASEYGGGLCMAEGLTRKGVEASSSLPGLQPVRAARGIVLLSLFGGLEGVRRALDLWGIVPERHLACEIDSAAVRASREAYPDIIHLGDVRDLSRSKLANALGGVSPVFVLLAAGSPCQGLTVLNALRQGWGDPRTQLLDEVIRIVQDCVREKLRVFVVVENVASMGSARGTFSQRLGLDPVEACASDLAHVRRPRLYWLSWKLGKFPDQRLVEGGPVAKLRFDVVKAPVARWSSAGWEPAAGEQAVLPTLTRPGPRSGPGFMPAGLRRASPAALERWAQDAWRYPPYIYNYRHLMKETTTDALRLPSATEKECLMFLGGSLTRGCMNATKIGPQAREYEDLRCSLVGNAFHAGVVAALLRPLLVQEQLLPESTTLQTVVDRQSLRSGFVFSSDAPMTMAPPVDTEVISYSFDSLDAARKAVDPDSTPAAERKLVRYYLRSADYRGSDVRLDTGQLLRPAAWPRQSLDPSKWVWHSRLAVPYRHRAHINVLELTMILTTLRHRTSSSKWFRSRFLHLVDSQVCLGVVCKGRSSSLQLMRVLRRVNALQLATHTYPLFAYVQSKWNPADHPSRRFDPPPRGVRKGHLKRVTSRGFNATLGYPGEGPKNAQGLRPVRRQRSLSLRFSKRGVPHILHRRTASERRRERKGIVLQQGGLQPFTVKVYREAFMAFWGWLGLRPPERIRTPHLLDECMAEFIIVAWKSGTTKATIGNLLSAMLTVYPECGRELSESWHLLRAWRLIENPCRAPPATEELVLWLVYHALDCGSPAGAFLFAISFDCLLRCGEAVSLRWKDCLFPENGHAVISLAETKRGQRDGMAESVVVLDPFIHRLFHHLRDSLPQPPLPYDLLWTAPPWRFRALFRAALARLSAEALGLRPHSLRRGGATSFYRRTGNLAATMERGRWTSARVARLYISDGMARILEMNLQPAQRAAVTAAAGRLISMV